MTIIIVLTIVVCHDSRIVMSQNITIAHLYLIFVSVYGRQQLLLSGIDSQLTILWGEAYGWRTILQEAQHYICT